MAYPDKTITIVVPTAAGGGNDAMARTIAQKLGPLLGQTVIVDNRAGANGAIASEFVARAAPDGHTLMFGYIATHAMNPALQKLRYDPVADFAPIGLVGYSPTLMVANPAAPVKDVKDLWRSSRPGSDSYTYASAGNGTAPHFAAELFKLNAGIVDAGAPYKGRDRPSPTRSAGRRSSCSRACSPRIRSFAPGRIAGRRGRRAHAAAWRCRLYPRWAERVERRRCRPVVYRHFDYRIGRRIGLLDGKPGFWWTINGELFPDVPMFHVTEGDVVRMTISNDSGDVHPIHLHGHHAVVLSRNGVPSTGSPWWIDSLNVADGETYEIAFVADNPGIWMDHCHNLEHARDGLVAHLAYAGVTEPFRVGGSGKNEPE